MILHQMTRQTTFGSSPAFGAHPFQRLPLRPDASGTVLMLRATSTFLFSCYAVILSLYESIVNPGSSKHRQNLPPPRYFTALSVPKVPASEHEPNTLTVTCSTRSASSSGCSGSTCPVRITPASSRHSKIALSSSRSIIP